LLDLKIAIQKELIKFENQQIQDQSFLQRGVTPREKVVSRLALIGAPNAGKSTLLNQLLGAERALVSDIPGTTVDPIEGFFDLYFGKNASELDQDLDFAKSDSLLFQQYEEFRANNPDLYNSLSYSYNLEEEGTNGNPIYDEDDYLSDETPLLDESIDEEIDFDQALSDEENEEYEKEVYEQIFDDESKDFTEDNFDFESEIEDEKEANKIEGSFWRSLHIVDTAGIRRQKSVEGFIEQQSVYRSLRCITESDIIIL